MDASGVLCREVSVDVAVLHSKVREAGGFEARPGKIPANWDSPAVPARVWDEQLSAGQRKRKVLKEGDKNRYGLAGMEGGRDGVCRIRYGGGSSQYQRYYHGEL